MLGHGLKTCIGLLATALCALAGPARAQGEAVSFAGKTITIIVGFGPGDGFDSYARLLARHIPKHLPGEPSIVVQNLPGAGSLTALNAVLNKGGKDGTTLGVVNPVSTIQPLLQPSIANFDPREIAWIGSMASDYYTCGFWTDKPVTLADLRARPIVIGSTALSGGTYAGNMVLSSVLGLDARNVAGYRTMGELVLAAERGEVEGHCGVMAVTLKSSFWQAYTSGRLKIVVAARIGADAELAHIPNAFDLVTLPEHRQWLTLLSGPWHFGRPIMAPAGLQPDVLDALRNGFEATMRDAEFRQAARAQNLLISPLTGPQVAATIKQIYAIPKETIERAKPMFGVKDN